MSLLFRLGLKNIGRNKGRSALTISAIVLCSLGITMFGVLMTGMMGMLSEGITNSNGHHRFVHEKIVKEQRLSQGKYFVDDANRIIRDIKKVPGVVTVAPRIELGAYIDNNGKQAPAQGLGVDPVMEKNILKLDKKMLKGRMIRSKGKEIVVGYRLAKRLKANIGDKLVLIGKTVDDSMSAIKVVVVGISQTGNIASDKMFYIPIPLAQYYLDISGRVSSILVFANTVGQGNALTVPLSQIKVPKGIMVQDWRNTQYAAAALPAISIMNYVMGALIIFIAGIGLMNTMTMTVLERRGEVGVMMALGFTPRRVAGIFLSEGMVLGLIGAVIGVGLGCLASIPLITTGISFGTEAVAKISIPISTTIKGSITMSTIITGLVVGVLATIAGTLWPSIQASRMEPVDALRD